MHLIELGLIFVYTCVLLIKACELSSQVCSTFGFGSSANGVFLFFILFGLSMLGLQLVS